MEFYENFLPNGNVHSNIKLDTAPLTASQDEQTLLMSNNVNDSAGAEGEKSFLLDDTEFPIMSQVLTKSAVKKLQKATAAKAAARSITDTKTPTQVVPLRDNCTEENLWSISTSQESEVTAQNQLNSLELSDGKAMSSSQFNVATASDDGDNIPMWRAEASMILESQETSTADQSKSSKSKITSTTALLGEEETKTVGSGKKKWKKISKKYKIRVVPLSDIFESEADVSHNTQDNQIDIIPASDSFEQDSMNHQEQDLSVTTSFDVNDNNEMLTVCTVDQVIEQKVVVENIEDQSQMQTASINYQMQTLSVTPCQVLTTTAVPQPPILLQTSQPGTLVTTTPQTFLMHGSLGTILTMPPTNVLANATGVLNQTHHLIPTTQPPSIVLHTSARLFAPLIAQSFVTATTNTSPITTMVPYPQIVYPSPLHATVSTHLQTPYMTTSNYNTGSIPMTGFNCTYPLASIGNDTADEQIPATVQLLYNTIKASFSDFSFVYALCSQLCQDRVPMESYVYFKMALMLSLCSITKNDSRAPASLCVICHDTYMANYLMKTVGQFAPCYQGPKAVDNQETEPDSSEAASPPPPSPPLVSQPATTASVSVCNCNETEPIALAKGGVCYLGEWSRLPAERTNQVFNTVENSSVSVHCMNCTQPLRTNIWTHWHPEGNRNVDFPVFEQFFRTFGLPIFMEDDISEVFVSYIFHQHQLSIYEPSNNLPAVPMDDIQAYIKIVAQRKLNVSMEAQQILKQYLAASRIERSGVITPQTFKLLKQFSESFAKLSMRQEVLIMDVVSAIFLCENFIQNVYGPSILRPPPFVAHRHIARVDAHMVNFQQWVENYIHNANVNFD